MYWVVDLYSEGNNFFMLGSLKFTLNRISPKNIA